MLYAVCTTVHALSIHVDNVSFVFVYNLSLLLMVAVVVLPPNTLQWISVMLSVIYELRADIVLPHFTYHYVCVCV